jgi:phospholipase C
MTRPRRPGPLAPGAARRWCERGDHVVVVVLQGRSFDHLLGHLTLHGRCDVNGLRPGMANLDRAGRVHFVHRVREPVRARMDDDPPTLSDQQVAGNRGFVQAFAAAHPTADPGTPMGYLDAEDVPTHTFLAAGYAVADAWFASVPAGPEANLAALLTESRHPTAAMPSILDRLEQRGRSWRWYGPAPSAVDRFAEDARAGRLADLSVVEPQHHGADADDDAVPADVARGQRLVAAVYDAVSAARGERWLRTLLVVVHLNPGGFFDHVAPPPGRGLRVPAVVVSPWIPPGVVLHTAVDHTIVARTVAARFCDPVATGGPPHLGALLTLDEPLRTFDRPQAPARR